MKAENSAREKALKIAEIAEDKKADGIVVLEVIKMTPIADFFVICSGSSEKQVDAIAREIEDEMAEQEIMPYRMAGRDQSRWKLLDYEDVIVHVFHSEERRFYNLERLWADAEKILEENSEQV
ncbi:ribosome silencing factor [Halarsenatibacter silvermanii]|uniref:Ribosomal silencing factor RsfS n=1 Tax=Halarsenatibacter silvermanii TaxID=321763 RepID=A0A1G9SP35_9FIRM|nr:ribosome silencing factor [Halarsenatibacter silvermanii]SDM37206.1 ribosome-associated protein [Halarsenatibacter silvermanii]